MNHDRTRVVSRLNLRDLGGLRSGGGQWVATGQVFRSGQLVDRPDEELAVLQALGLRTVLDLRSAHERSTLAGMQLPGAEHVWLDVLGDDAAAGPARLGQTLRQPQEASAQLGEGRAEQVFCVAYRELVSSPLARSAYGRLVRVLAAPDAGPVLFHCAAGKDRTGWAAALVLTALGVPFEDVLTDYLETNDGFLSSYEAFRDTWADGGGDPEVLLAVMSARPAYLDAAFSEMESAFGGIEGYLVDGLRLDTAVVEQLRSRLLVES